LGLIAVRPNPKKGVAARRYRRMNNKTVALH